MSEVLPNDGRTRFEEFDLAPEIMRAVADLGFTHCTPIQAEILPHCLKGRDAAGQAQTGTGKTAAFLITILQRLLREPGAADRPPGTPRALIMAPTRELVIQIENDAHDLGKYCDVHTVGVYGGMDFGKQKDLLESRAVDIVAATPGRLLDFGRRRVVRLDKVQVLVIDEADRMLDMGFMPDMRRIVYATPHKDRRQTLFFSATLNSDVTRLAAQWTREPVRVEVLPDQIAVDTVEQVVYILTAKDKLALLLNLIRQENLDKVLVFTNRRDQARRLADRLWEFGLSTALLSGDVPQKKRLKTLESFRSGEVNVLVATDVAARGLHVEDISHVVNYNLPDNPEDYVHRIGRTGRAGATGTSVSFACEAEAMLLPDIEEYLGTTPRYIRPEAEMLTLPDGPRRKAPKRHSDDVASRSGRRRGGAGGGRSGGRSSGRSSGAGRRR